MSQYRLASFPNECKVAKIKSLYKKGLKTDHKSFRPISLLSLISKVLEQVIDDQTMDFLSDNDVLYRFAIQFLSTDSCFVILLWQNHKRLQFWFPDGNSFYWFTKGIRCNLPQYFN